MILFFALLGLYLLLWTPYLGHLLQHGFGHATQHVLEDHEHAFLVVLIALFWLFVLGGLAATLLGFWWIAADAVLSLLLLFRLFGAGH